MIHPRPPSGFRSCDAFLLAPPGRATGTVPAEVTLAKGECRRPPLVPSALLGFEEAIDAAEEGAESTCNMEALAGRANYVAAQSLKGVPDPGAKAAAYVLKALSGVLMSD